MIFISHTERDEASAEALAAFLVESIQIPPDRIRRTGSPSNEDYAQMCRRLKEDIGGSDVILALISPDSLCSSWVIFELGAAWAMDKLLFLFFKSGIDFRDVPEPLSHYPSVDVDHPHAHITIMDMVRDIADFLGLPERKDGNTFISLERLLDTMQSTSESGGEPDEDEAPRQASAPIGLDAVKDDFVPDGREYCDVVCTFEVLARGISQPQQVVVRASWDDLFKSFASHLETPQDDDHIRKLILELCKERNATFAENCRIGMYRKPAVAPDSYRQIVRHFKGLGYIEPARAPHSAFRGGANLSHWVMTEKGEDYLRRTLVVRKALQEWVYKEKHVQRSAARKLSPPPRYE
ncbi:toll/interleukin-1 receptor domain-containing protein [Synergistaceae bacterium OttesenSCG-928-I11]|nr:toll/interleukin-1 receptor domain-containing protein [Synergistaceae bacterium OttesenSCG-928-I11]